MQVEFDPARISYEQLLDVFWRLHDPTTLNRQGPDFGTQYRSAIFYHNEAQHAAAEASRDRLAASGAYRRPIVTQIVPARRFILPRNITSAIWKKTGWPAATFPGAEHLFF